MWQRIKVKRKYFTNLNKIEFAVTYACTGRCKHCSEGAHSDRGVHINPTLAADAVRKIAGAYDIKTVMAFGGEPLLYPDAVYAIMSAAREMGVEQRQVITNGFFTKSGAEICNTAERLYACGVNDLLLSVDSFHQETIPLCDVRFFAEQLLKYKVSVRLSPAWLVSKEDDNPYNGKTREILDSFADLGIKIGDGNIVFPEGNAKKFLAEYFGENTPQNPYTQDPCQIKCISVDPSGDVLDGNLYRNDIIEIIKNYHPVRN